MSAGRRFKFAGSTISVMTGFTGLSPSLVITAITKANPAVVTSAGHGLVNGDVVRILDVVGMVEVNSGVYIVDNKTNDTFELFDTDSSGYTTYSSSGHIDKAALSNFCELTNYNRQGGTSPQIPATALCSTAQEFEVGLPDFGTTALSFNFAPGTSVQGALHDFYVSGQIIAVKVALPNSGGNMVQLGFVQQESETAGVGGLWTAQSTLKNTGNRYDF